MYHVPVFRKVPKCPLSLPVARPPDGALQHAADVLRDARRPLLICGKGVQWSERGPGQLRQFVQATRLPYLNTPGGKGALPDEHELSVAAARS